MQPDAKETGPRIAAIDVGRGVALAGMALYHLSWDCAYFGLAPAEFPLTPPMRLFSHAVAGAFLLLAGVSLALAHPHGLRPRAFWRRLGWVGGAAALVTAASLAFAPEQAILFGILHCIAFVHGALLRAVGRANWQMWFTLGGALTNLIGFYCFVRLGVLYVAGWYVVSAYLWLAIDLRMIRSVLGHSTLSYLGRFSPPVFKGLAVAAAVVAVRAAFPAAVPDLWRFAAEATAGILVFAVTNSSIVFNPLGALREIAAK